MSLSSKSSFIHSHLAPSNFPRDNPKKLISLGLHWPVKEMVGALLHHVAVKIATSTVMVDEIIILSRRRRRRSSVTDVEMDRLNKHIDGNNEEEDKKEYI